MEKNEIPIGFGMALAQNPEAMQKFALLSEDEKQKFMNEAHTVRSKEQMREYVNKLVSES